MKILLLRVGIDRGCGGRLSPMLPNGYFDYIPIPESKHQIISSNGVRFDRIPSRIYPGKYLDIWVNTKKFPYAHYDPEFTTFTYGEPSHPKRSQLLRLSAGDLLVFYAGFQPEGKGNKLIAGTCFIIGYFCIKNIHELSRYDYAIWPPSQLGHLSRNAHFKRKIPEPDLVIAEGDQSMSRLFETGLKFSDGNRQIPPEITKITGLKGDVTRSIGRWVTNEHIDSTRDWLINHK